MMLIVRDQPSICEAGSIAGTLTTLLAFMATRRMSLSAGQYPDKLHGGYPVHSQRRTRMPPQRAYPQNDIPSDANALPILQVLAHHSHHSSCC
jgi:hypothetical protein